MQSVINNRVRAIVTNRLVRHSTDWLFSCLAQPTIVACELARWLEVSKAINLNSLRSYAATLKQDTELLSSLLRNSNTDLATGIETSADLRQYPSKGVQRKHVVIRYIQIRVETLLLGNLSARDIVSQLMISKVRSTKDFLWYCQLKLSLRKQRYVLT